MIRIGDKIDGRYRVLSRIATGGMSDVYEGNDLVARRIVSIKVMKEDLLRNPENVERFTSETAVAASFSHPNIVRVYDRGVVEGRPYMVQEFIKGQTLREKLNFSQTLSLPDACEVMLQLSSAIGLIHSHGLVHRDIKPENIFYLSDGTIKISDFGISAPIGTLPDGVSVQGTIYYCAPEVLMGKPAAIGNDIYSMGVLFYEVLTGQVPFDGATPDEVAAKQMKNRFPRASDLVPSLPKVVDRIIFTCCAKSIEDRYMTADDFHDTLLEAMKDKDHFQERRGLLARIFGFK